MIQKEAAGPCCGRNNAANHCLPLLGAGRGVPSGGAGAWWAEQGPEMGLRGGGQCP